ncbi:MAG TPA: hypothetical protein VFB16_09650 [Bauldia sp.]|nr:hypothetical protein [Bauldia sp.]
MMEFILGIAGTVAIVLGLLDGANAVRAYLESGGPLLNAALVTALSGPASTFVTGIVLAGLAAAIRLLRQIRDSSDRTAHYLYSITRPSN